MVIEFPLDPLFGHLKSIAPVVAQNAQIWCKILQHNSLYYTLYIIYFIQATREVNNVQTMHVLQRKENYKTTPVNCWHLTNLLMIGWVEKRVREKSFIKNTFFFISHLHVCWQIWLNWLKNLINNVNSSLNIFFLLYNVIDSIHK